MSRLHLSRQRITETKKQNIGKIILFCEGITEKYYFDYFAEIINKDENKYNNVVIETEAANGNAQAVLNYSNDFLSREDKNRLFSNYGKYLVFDCDAPNNIASIINNACSNSNEYHLLISNHFFETWLLMHFEEVNKKLSKRETYARLSAHLSEKYKKGRKGRIRQIISLGDIEKAIENAERLERQYVSKGKSIYDSIDDMNPYTNVYTLIQQLLLLIS